MSRPDDKTIKQTVDKMHTHLERLCARLKAANRVDRRGGTVRQNDGYPKGGGGPGPTNQVGRPTESAMLANYRTEDKVTDEHEGGRGRFVNPRDPVRDFFERAWAHTQAAERELAIVIQQLDSIEALAGEAVEPEPCEACFAFDRSTPMEYFGDVGGRLEIKMRLCAWHRWQVHRKGKLPTEHQVHGHHDGVVRVDPTVAGTPTAVAE